MKSLSAVFWDLDGTLADTELNGHRIAFNEAFAKAGVNWHWSCSEYIKLLQIHGGINRLRTYAEIHGISVRNELINELHLDKQKNYQQLIKSNGIKLRTGVSRLLTEFSSRDIKQYIVTTSSKTAVQALIASMNVNDSKNINGIITSDDVNLVKPSPEAYLKAIAMSNVDRANIIVIEDSLVGLTAAKNANLKCLITLSPWKSKPSPGMEGAICVANHLGDISERNEILIGKPCTNGQITVQYLEGLLSEV